MARDSATNKALNSARELTKSINPFDAPFWLSRNGLGFSRWFLKAMVVDLKLESIGEVHGGFRAILHSRQTLRTSLHKTSRVEERRARGIHFSKRLIGIISERGRMEWRWHEGKKEEEDALAR